MSTAAVGWSVMMASAWTAEPEASSDIDVDEFCAADCICDS